MTTVTTPRRIVPLVTPTEVAAAAATAAAAQLTYHGGPVLTAVVAMARALGLTVVAEGIETEAQLAFAARHGVDLAQGNLLGRVETAGYLAGASSSIA